MRIKKISQLREGDIVRHVSGGEAWKIIAVFGDRATGVRIMDFTNPPEWEIVFRADYRKVK